ncbi:MAG: nitroreductase family protein [Pseudomonadales bacterium]|nr:nitroreductase family protein [Pseudomonadales bacterium]
MSEDMSLFDAMYNCRAMRRLKTDAVPTELLVKLIDAGNQAPSGSNRQAARWIVVRDADTRAELARLNKVSVQAYIGPQSGRPSELPHHSSEKRQRMLQSVMWQADNMQDIPALIIACYQFDAPVGPGEAARAGGSIWPGVQNVLLAARALGLGAAPTTLGLMDRDATKAALNLPEDMEAICLIPVGYPIGNFGPVTRMPVDQVMRWDAWS